MAIKQGKPKPRKGAVPVFGSASAPIVPIEGVVAYGVYNGTLQIECGHNILVPGAIDEDEPVQTQIMVTQHLRMSVPAAINLVGAIKLALDMHKKQRELHKAKLAKQRAANQGDDKGAAATAH